MKLCCKRMFDEWGRYSIWRWSVDDVINSSRNAAHVSFCLGSGYDFVVARQMSVRTHSHAFSSQRVQIADSNVSTYKGQKVKAVKDELNNRSCRTAGGFLSLYFNLATEWMPSVKMVIRFEKRNWLSSISAVQIFKAQSRNKVPILGLFHVAAIDRWRRQCGGRSGNKYTGPDAWVETDRNKVGSRHLHFSTQHTLFRVGAAHQQLLFFPRSYRKNKT